MRRFVPVLLLAVAAAACSSPDTDPAPGATAPATPTTTSSAASPTTAPEESSNTPPCLEGDRPFSTSGVISAFGGAAGDARQISGIRTGLHAECERVVVDLLTADGAPAGSLGLVGVEYDAAVGIVRINLPTAVVRTAVADLRLDGELADRAYLVDTTAGNLALDIHVVPGSQVAVRAFEVASPSRIVVDLKPEPSALAATGAVSGQQMVVTRPARGAAQPPLIVSGYTRSSSSQILASLHSVADGPAIASAETAATSSDEAWNEFQVEFSEPLSGTAVLQIRIPPEETPLVSVPIDLGPAEELDAGDT